MVLTLTIFFALDGSTLVADQPSSAVYRVQLPAAWLQVDGVVAVRAAFSLAGMCAASTAAAVPSVGGELWFKVNEAGARPDDADDVFLGCALCGLKLAAYGVYAVWAGLEKHISICRCCISARAPEFASGVAKVVKVIGKEAAPVALASLHDAIALLASSMHGTSIDLDAVKPTCVAEHGWHVMLREACRHSCIVNVLIECYKNAKGRSSDDFELFVSCAASRSGRASIKSPADISKSIIPPKGSSGFYWSITVADFQSFGGAQAQLLLNCLLPVVALMNAQCPRFEFKGCSQDGLDRVLILIGGEGTGTPVHADPCAAINFAVSLDAQHDGEVVAWWLFFRPSAEGLELLRELIRASAEAPPPVTRSDADSGATAYVLRGCSSTRKPPVWSLKFMQKVASEHPSKVVLVGQKSGTAVHVPIGWPHCVVNAHPSMKVAFDFVPADPDALPRAAAAWHKVVSPIMGQRAAEDYVLLLPRAFQHFVSTVCE